MTAKTEQISLRLPAEMLREIRALAKRDRRTPSEAARIALELGLVAWRRNLDRRAGGRPTAENEEEDR